MVIKLVFQQGHPRVLGPKTGKRRSAIHVAPVKILSCKEIVLWVLTVENSDFLLAFNFDLRTLELNWNINGKNKCIYTEQNALSSYAPKVPLSLKETSMYFSRSYSFLLLTSQWVFWFVS